MQTRENARGFEIAEFVDTHGVGCSIQQSSAIGPEGTASFLWIGPNQANPRIMASQAAKHGVETTEITGWVPFPVPDGVLMNTRMHVDRKQVEDIVAHLMTWLRTGSLNYD